MAYAVFCSGGVVPADWNLCLLALGLLMVWYGAGVSQIAPPLDQAFAWLSLIWVGYAVLQAVPLPLGLVRVLSPARAEIAAALEPIALGSRFASLSVVPHATLAHAARLAAYTAIFLLVREITARLPEKPWAPAFPVIAVALMQACLGLVQYRAGAAHAHGTYVNQNHFAGLLEMALPFPVMHAVAIVRRHRRLSVMMALQACALIAAAALMLAAIVCSFSRMGFLAALASLALAGSLALPARRRWAAIAVVAGSFVFLPPDQLIGRFGRLTPTEHAAGARLELWRETRPLIAEYPLTGAGLGGFESAFLKHKRTGLEFRDDYAHNDYLQLLAELGICGFLIGAALLAMVVVRTAQAVARQSSEARYVSLACLAAMAAMLLHSLADFNLYIPANALVLAWIGGVSAGVREIELYHSNQEVIPCVISV
ncbi:MAG: O-antigen ligase family protein [Acidobacteria bacterium]|nr:O-antigen ligase family protein [Acidobacteriota bacterium]